MQLQVPEKVATYQGQLHDTVFIVDDDPSVLKSLYASLTLAGFSVVRFAGAERFLEYVTDRHSGCLLTDICMPGMSGLELQEELARRNKLLSVIVMSGHADVPLAVRAMKAGALEILQKPFSYDQLVAQVRAALEISRQWTMRASGATAAAQKLDLLTMREQEVLKLMIQGHVNKEIARSLYISPRTVEVHRARLMYKLDADSVAQLVHITNAASGA
jgi:two-component system response regulator FixJ